MKSLSDRLTELSDRASQIEDLLSSTRDKNLEALTARRTALQTSLTHGGRRLEGVGEDATRKIKAPWRNAHAALESVFTTVHEAADEHRGHKDVAKARRRAEHAEDDAAGAAALAGFVLDQTECAVAEAVLARAHADALAAAETGAGEADAGPVDHAEPPETVPAVV